jgi:polyhydroxyalkanoate synthesis regulator phasin
MVCEWTPPKRRKLVQKLHPTGKFNAAMRKIHAGQLEGLKDRIDELTKSGDLTEEESKTLIAEINAKG